MYAIKSMLTLMGLSLLLGCGASKSDEGEKGVVFSITPSEVLFNFEVTARTSSKVELTWSAIDGMDPATDVIIEYRKAGVGEFEKQNSGTPQISALQKDIENLEADTDYEFRAKLSSGDEFSPYSATKTVRTFAQGFSAYPSGTGLTATRVASSSDYKIQLEWTYTPGSLEEIEKVEVMRKNKPSTAEILLVSRTGALDIAKLIYDDTSVTYNAAYDYIVRVFYKDGTSATQTALTDQVMNLANPDTLVAPGAFIISATTEDNNGMYFILETVSLAWSMSNWGEDGHNGYEIRMCQGVAPVSPASPCSQLGSETISVPNQTSYVYQTSVICNSVNPNLEVHFRIKATSTQGNPSSEAVVGGYVCREPI